ncbi:M24 family metallopeptidase [Tumebacillus permanentifrigoris]|uniref:Xaa-Pro aminopeptidase n=1 Tax=Tumebacillus permanentifrigoris TaxID=378543 RepID=A0A316D3S5_9BACL|nr:M24 family metallopeptidase [Tumebacillus permanentifrigoris]PWK06592.1 Xaa-Pro aminopeptidase [Tumebacillus permanentifrigoris]
MMQERVEQVRTLMGAWELDGVLLRKRRSFAWLTGGRTNHIVNTSEHGVCDLLVLPDRVVCIVTQMEAARIRDEELAEMSIEWVVSEWYEGHAASIAKLCTGKSIGTDVEPESVEGLRDGVNLSSSLAELTYVLSEPQIDAYRWLAQRAARAVESLCQEIEPGMTEYEIQARLAAKVIKDGINPQVILIATDERIYNYRHPIPTGKVLRSYAMVVLCAERYGLVANVTRFVHFGALDRELEENRLKLAEIDLTMNLATSPGTPIRDIFFRGIEAYRAAGHGEDWRYLHQGGPTGYASREFLATPDCTGIVQVNQAFAWNPAIRGIKSEDTLLVRAEGNEFLTHTGAWKYIMMERQGQPYKRPDILVR